VWLNQYQSQFLPILGLLGLRMVVGAGEWLLRKLGKEKKSEQASAAAASFEQPCSTRPVHAEDLPAALEP